MSAVNDGSYPGVAPPSPSDPRSLWARWLVGLALIGLALLPTELGQLVRDTFAEAYLAVTVFVAATLALFYVAERRLDIDTAGLLARHRGWQVPIASFLGALPGCGGAIVVVTQFVHGRISFGSLVAVLVSTMGDAAFLLLSQKPILGVSIFGMGFVVGTLSGVIVDWIHGPDFMRRKDDESKSSLEPGLMPMAESLGAALSIRELPTPTFQRAWLWLLIPSLIIGILGAFQVDLSEALSQPWIGAAVLGLGVVGAIFSLLIWMKRGGASLHTDTVTCADGLRRLSPLSRVVTDTAFVTTWVILGFLAFELTVHYTGLDLKEFFAQTAPVVPLLAVVVGLLPGCGPQIITTTLYLSGFIPLSAQLGNAISNDGDALFPALALAPRAAAVATLYSTIPALIVAYGFYLLFE